MRTIAASNGEFAIWVLLKAMRVYSCPLPMVRLLAGPRLSSNHELASVSAVVKKTRTVYLIGQTRVHIDEVEELGTFLELELVLRNVQMQAEGKAIAERLMSEFGIERRQIIPEAYIDLIRHH